jgi:hypothetical protein
VKELNPAVASESITPIESGVKNEQRKHDVGCIRRSSHGSLIMNSQFLPVPNHGTGYVPFPAFVNTGCPLSEAVLG